MKYRVLWLNNGDANIKFFNMSTLQRRIRNHITRLRENVDNWLTEELLILNHIIGFYESLYLIDHNISNWSHAEATSAVIPPDRDRALVAPLLPKEVVYAIYAFKPFNELGSDGLHPFFYQKF